MKVGDGEWTVEDNRDDDTIDSKCNTMQSFPSSLKERKLRDPAATTRI